MIKVLSIGNSFSQDAHTYLYRIAKSEGVQMKCMNLFIGGCSLRTHYLNMLNDSRSYMLEFNGQSTGIKVSLSEALSSDDWDYITLQQASHFSFDFDTYVPYITELADYVRMYAPKAKILLHQTWAYEQGSVRLKETAGFDDAAVMFDKIEKSYDDAAKFIGADGIIPCGKAMMCAIEKTNEKMHRDSFHADLGIGRYLLGLVWYMTLTGNKANNDFSDFDVSVEDDKKSTIKSIAEQVCNF